MYQDAQMIMTKDITSGVSTPPIESSKQGEDNKNLLDLNPSDVVFYVGGYPSNFTVSKSQLQKKNNNCLHVVPAAVLMLLLLPSLRILSNSPCTRAASSSSP